MNVINKADWFYRELARNSKLYREDKLKELVEKEQQEKTIKLIEDKNKAYKHIVDELRAFISEKRILNDYDIETDSSVDLDYNKVTDKLQITIRMSRDI